MMFIVAKSAISYMLNLLKHGRVNISGQNTIISTRFNPSPTAERPQNIGGNKGEGVGEL